MVRALPSHQCGPGSNPGVDAICGLSLLLVLCVAPRGFSPGTPVFPSHQKPTFPNSNSTRNQADEEPLCGCATCKSLFMYSFYLFIYVRPLDIRPSGFNPSLKPLKKLYKPRAYKRQFMVRQMALREYEGLEIN